MEARSGFLVFGSDMLLATGPSYMGVRCNRGQQHSHVIRAICVIRGQKNGRVTNQISRKAVATGMRAARIAGKSPPIMPITAA
jgi:hypothetical protein